MDPKNSVNVVTLYVMKKDYHKFLEGDNEYLGKPFRYHYIVDNIKYKGKTISVAIPHRSNINRYFQNFPDEYMETQSSYKTDTSEGKVGGWHITKSFPVTYNNVVARNLSAPNFVDAFNVIDANRDDLHIKVQKFVRKVERSAVGSLPVLDFDACIAELDRLDQKSSGLKRVRVPKKKTIEQPTNAEVLSKAPPLSESVMKKVMDDMKLQRAGHLGKAVSRSADRGRNKNKYDGFYSE